jgi:hypothetical protein
VYVVARDQTRDVVATVCDTRKFVQDPASAEAVLAAWKAVDLSIKRGWRRIILEGDSVEVVQALSRDGIWWGRYGAGGDTGRKAELFLSAILKPLLEVSFIRVRRHGEHHNLLFLFVFQVL